MASLYSNKTLTQHLTILWLHIAVVNFRLNKKKLLNINFQNHPTTAHLLHAFCSITTPVLSK